MPQPGWDALLSDGGVVHVRPVRGTDRQALVALHADSSDRSIYLRYFTLNRRAGERYVDHLLAEDDRDQLGLVAELSGRVVAMASCERLPGTADADVALLVADQAQRRGIGTLLLEHLAALARHAGVRRFLAEVLADNGRMLSVFADAGMPLERTAAEGEVRFTIPLTPTRSAQEAVDARELSADVRSSGMSSARRRSPSWAPVTGPAPSAARCCAASSPEASPDRSSPSTGARTRCRACRPTRRSRTCPVRWTSRSSRCRPRRSPG